MSSSDLVCDVVAVEPTADETVPRMNDTTNNEKECYKKKRLWRRSIRTDADRGRNYCWLGWLLSPAVFAVPSVFTIIYGVLLRELQPNMIFSRIEMVTAAATFVMIVLFLLLIVSVVTLLGGIAPFLYFRFSGVQLRSVHRKRFFLILSVFFFLHFVLFTFGFTAAILIPSLSGTTQLVGNTTFNKYLSNQSVQEYFDNVQHNLQCCGVVAFTDYESIFNNLSVPVSCCNTTNRLANETTCPAIVSNAQHANQTALIYSQGCALQIYTILQSSAIFVASFVGVSFAIGVLQTMYNFLMFLCSGKSCYFVYRWKSLDLEL